MPRILVKARELTEANVKYVSLVKRGANRSPFRIQKAEPQAMLKLDISSIFKTDRAKPVVLALAIAKGADLEAAQARVKAAGYTVTKTETSDGGSVLLVTGDALPEKFDTIKLDATTALLVANPDFTHIRKSLETYTDSGVFSELMAPQGFIPGVNMALSTGFDAVLNIVQAAKDQDTASTQIGAAFDEMKSYVLGLVTALPVDAFKLEAKVAKSQEATAPAAAVKPAGQEGAAAATAVTTEKTEDAAAKAAAAAAAATATAGDGKTAPAAGTAEVVKSEAAAATEEKPVVAAATAAVVETKDANTLSIEVVKGLLKEVTDGVTATVNTAIAGITKSVEALGTRVASAEEVAKSADKAVRGVVVGGTTQPDRAAVAATKSDGGRLIDTAYERNGNS
jgi:hypothetical protein